MPNLQNSFQNMLLNNLMDQMNFQKANSDDAITQDYDYHQNNQWLGEDNSFTQQQPLPDELLNEIEGQSEGNSIDRFIKNGYTDPDMPDDDYMSDKSLKEFLQGLRRESGDVKKEEE